VLISIANRPKLVITFFDKSLVFLICHRASPNPSSYLLHTFCANPDSRKHFLYSSFLWTET